MKIQEKITIFAGGAQGGEGTDRTGKTGGGARDGHGKTIFAGNLQGDFSLEDRIRRKQEQARKQALKVVTDAWNGDRKIDEELDKSRGRIKELQESNKAEQAKLGDIAKEREELKEVYGITDDSQEEAELDLLRRGREALRSSDTESLTKEEWEQYNALQSKELTEYQNRQLDLDGREQTSRDILYNNNLKMECENAVIRGIRHERLKKDPMVGAQKQADSILESARDEIVGMVVEDAKEHIDEKQEEREEQAEEVKEKKEEQEEILEERKEREEEQVDIMEDMSVEQMSDIHKTQDEIRQEVQKIVDKMNLVADDIKGSMVDSAV